MNNERNFLGVWIPKEIWLSTELTLVDKAILTEVQSLDNDDHCYASNEYLAEFCGCSIATVSRSINKLINMGLIEVVSFNGRNRTIKFVEGSLIKLINQPSQNDQAALSNCQANNIDNNKETNIDNTNRDDSEDTYLKNKNKRMTSLEVINYFNSMCGTRYKGSKSNLKIIDRLFKEGFSLQDIRDVIEYKYEQWGRNPYMMSNGQMSDYNLTLNCVLNSSRFDGYLEQARKSRINTNSEVRLVPIRSVPIDDDKVEVFY